MTRTIGIMSMSLDGFVADPDGGVAEVFDWYACGDVEVPAGGVEGMTFRMSAADTIQQCLNAGLLDELAIDVSAVLLGSGVRMFEHIDGTPFALGDPTVTQGARVTHLRYRVRR